MCVQSTKRIPAGTLIVCPSSLMKQWADELLNKACPEAKLSVSMAPVEVRMCRRYQIMMLLHLMALLKMQVCLLLLHGLEGF